MGFFASSGILNRRGFFGGAAAAAPFVPTDISGLQLWLDSTTGLFDSTSGGNPVTTDTAQIARWEDQSGNSRHFRQSTVNERPRLRTSIQNGKNVVRFDGISDFMSMTSAFSGLGSACYFVALKIQTDPPTTFTRTGHPIFFLNGTPGNGFASHYPFTDGTIYDNTMSLNARRTVGNPTPSLTNFHLYNVQAGSAEWTARLNKTVLFTTATNTFAQNNTNIGRTEDANPNYHLDGDIGEIIVYNSILSSSDRILVENYLYSKWAII